MANPAQFPPISIRSASNEDVPGILACLRAAFEPYRNLYTSGAFLDTVLTPETLNQRLVDMQVSVALNPAGQLVGTIAGNLSSPAEGHLRGMAVLQAWPGRSIIGARGSRAKPPRMRSDYARHHGTSSACHAFLRKTRLSPLRQSYELLRYALDRVRKVVCATLFRGRSERLPVSHHPAPRLES